MQEPWMPIIIMLIIITLLIVAIAINKGKKHKPDYYTFFIMGIIWIGAGIPMKNYALSAMGLIFLIIGGMNKDKWKKNHRPWKKLSKKERKTKSIVIGILTVALVIGVLLFYITKNSLIHGHVFY